MMTCVCGFTPAARNAAIALALGRRAVGVQGRTSRPGGRVVTRSGGHGLDVDVEGIERRAVVVLGHVVSRGGSWGNLRAAVDQRADRFFLQNIPPPPRSTKRAAYRVPSRALLGGLFVLTCSTAQLACTETTALVISSPSATAMQWQECANCGHRLNLGLRPSRLDPRSPKPRTAGPRRCLSIGT
jgi:hypothetical protein